VLVTGDEGLLKLASEHPIATPGELAKDL